MGKKLKAVSSAFGSLYSGTPRGASNQTPEVCAGVEWERCAICHEEPGLEKAPAQVVRLQVRKADDQKCCSTDCEPQGLTAAWWFVSQETVHPERGVSKGTQKKNQRPEQDLLSHQGYKFLGA